MHFPPFMQVVGSDLQRHHNYAVVLMEVKEQHGLGRVCAEYLSCCPACSRFTATMKTREKTNQGEQHGAVQHIPDGSPQTMIM